ncbi:MAG TPA: DUF742 domain-containing protein [Pseudonocardiaceae bacterium]
MVEQAGRYDEPTGRLVRPYALTGGRTSTTHAQLDLATQIMVARTDFDRTDLEPEHEEILVLCRRPLAVAEIAARMNIPLFVAKVLLGDLIDRGALEAGQRIQDMAPPDLRLMEQILDRLQAL